MIRAMESVAVQTFIAAQSGMCFSLFECCSFSADFLRYMIDSAGACDGVGSCGAMKDVSSQVVLSIGAGYVLPLHPFFLLGRVVF